MWAVARTTRQRVKTPRKAQGGPRRPKMASWPPWVFTGISALFDPIRPRWPTGSLLHFSQAPEVVVGRVLPAADRSDERSRPVRRITGADQRAGVCRCIGGAVI